MPETDTEALLVCLPKNKITVTLLWRLLLLDKGHFISVFESPEGKAMFEEVLKLPEKYRIAIHLFYYEDYSVKEIAEILHTSESNVKVRLSRGRKMLKKTLQEAWEDNDE